MGEGSPGSQGSGLGRELLFESEELWRCATQIPWNSFSEMYHFVQYSLPCLQISMGFLFFALEGVCFLEEAHYKVIKTENQDIFIRSSV